MIYDIRVEVESRRVQGHDCSKLFVEIIRLYHAGRILKRNIAHELNLNWQIFFIAIWMREGCEECGYNKCKSSLSYTHLGYCAITHMIYHLSRATIGNPKLISCVEEDYDLELFISYRAKYILSFYLTYFSVSVPMTMNGNWISNVSLFLHFPSHILWISFCFKVLFAFDLRFGRNPASDQTSSRHQRRNFSA